MFKLKRFDLNDNYRGLAALSVLSSASVGVKSEDGSGWELENALDFVVETAGHFAVSFYGGKIFVVFDSVPSAYQLVPAIQTKLERLLLYQYNDHFSNLLAMFTPSNLVDVVFVPLKHGRELVLFLIAAFRGGICNIWRWEEKKYSWTFLVKLTLESGLDHVYEENVCSVQRQKSPGVERMVVAAQPEEEETKPKGRLTKIYGYAWVKGNLRQMDLLYVTAIDGDDISGSPSRQLLTKVRIRLNTCRVTSYQVIFDSLEREDIGSDAEIKELHGLEEGCVFSLATRSSIRLFFVPKQTLRFRFPSIYSIGTDLERPWLFGVHPHSKKFLRCKDGKVDALEFDSFGVPSFSHLVQLPSGPEKYVRTHIWGYLDWICVAYSNCLICMVCLRKRSDGKRAQPTQLVILSDAKRVKGVFANGLYSNNSIYTFHFNGTRLANDIEGLQLFGDFTYKEQAEFHLDKVLLSLNKGHVAPYEDGCCMATSLDSEMSISLLHETRFDEKILEGLERCDSFDEEMGTLLKQYKILLQEGSSLGPLRRRRNKRKTTDISVKHGVSEDYLHPRKASPKRGTATAMPTATVLSQFILQDTPHTLDRALEQVEGKRLTHAWFKPIQGHQICLPPLFTSLVRLHDRNRPWSLLSFLIRLHDEQFTVQELCEHALNILPPWTPNLSDARRKMRIDLLVKLNMNADACRYLLWEDLWTVDTVRQAVTIFRTKHQDMEPHRAACIHSRLLDLWLKHQLHKKAKLQGFSSLVSSWTPHRSSCPGVNRGPNCRASVVDSSAMPDASVFNFLQSLQLHLAESAKAQIGAESSHQPLFTKKNKQKFTNYLNYFQRTTQHRPRCDDL